MYDARARARPWAGDNPPGPATRESVSAFHCSQSPGLSTGWGSSGRRLFNLFVLPRKGGSGHPIAATRASLLAAFLAIRSHTPRPAAPLRAASGETSLCAVPARTAQLAPGRPSLLQERATSGPQPCTELSIQTGPPAEALTVVTGSGPTSLGVSVAATYPTVLGLGRAFPPPHLA